MSTKIRCPECGSEMEVKTSSAVQYILQCKTCQHVITYLTEKIEEKSDGR